ncbi:hypothetical protein GIB67_028058 [Kingdonia uniflora]|uniref:Uncharacterized protein n=1 Tax=Kingdonia uniflora TaxID=39325 RepID=A0A7J7L1B7_9MAGN|nr:hypothetical protein GIB67_028058 [Kingdonia uniflora]
MVKILSQAMALPIETSPRVRLSIYKYASSRITSSIIILYSCIELHSFVSNISAKHIFQYA